jgi:predicted Zn-dependent protease with MMP-like domain
VGLDPHDRSTLLGLYHGVPLTQRNTYYAALPDTITIYQQPIERFCGEDEDEIREQVRHTVIHEIAHHYGISDERLDELGYD